MFWGSVAVPWPQQHDQRTTHRPHDPPVGEPVNTPAFSVTSPRLDRLATRMRKVDIVDDVIVPAARHTAELFVKELKDAYQHAGASEGLVSAVKVYWNQDDLTNRERIPHGALCVGLPGSLREADEADELEWGGLDTGPKGVIRNTVASRRKTTVQLYSTRMTRELDRVLR